MRLSVAGNARDHNDGQIACSHSHGHDDQLVVVRAEWNGWRTAHVRVVDLEDIHWWCPVGAPRPLIHAFVSCRAAVAGGLSHCCDAKTAHRVQICILKCHVASCVFQELAARAVQRHDLYTAGSRAGLEAPSRYSSPPRRRLIVIGLSTCVLTVSAGIAWMMAFRRKRTANLQALELVGPPQLDDATSGSPYEPQRNSGAGLHVEVPIASIDNTQARADSGKGGIDLSVLATRREAGMRLTTSV
jgi:hypothetical protein